jgi:hypothetical protein
MKEAAQRKVQPRVRRAVVAYGRIRDLGAAATTVQSIEEAHEVGAVGTVHRCAIRSRARRRADDTGQCNRQLGIEARDMQDRLGLEVERRRILPEVGELDDTGVRRALDEKCLIALAAEVRRGSLEAEEIRCDPYDVVVAEARRAGFEDGAHSLNLAVAVEIDAVGLLDDVPSVDHDRLAGDVTRLVAGEECDDRSDLVGGARSADRGVTAGDELVGLG